MTQLRQDLLAFRGIFGRKSPLRWYGQWLFAPVIALVLCTWILLDLAMVSFAYLSRMMSRSFLR
jgi:hypothetical protein